MEKIDRKEVFGKYGDHCAYCGRQIEYKDMQVDHITPRRNGGTDDISNLNPSCRLCNHYKRAEELSTWRDWLLAGVIERLMKVYLFRVALAFGMIEIKGWDKRFFFEKLKNK